MSRYTILLKKPYKRKVDADAFHYFMGISSNENRFTLVVGHLEILPGEEFFFKTDVDANYHNSEDLVHSSPMNLYMGKNNLNIKIKEGSEQEDLLEYLSQMNRSYKVIPMGTKWQDDLGSALRFFKINYPSSWPEYTYNSFLLALSACVDAIETYGKEFLRA